MNKVYQIKPERLAHMIKTRKRFEEMEELIQYDIPTLGQKLKELREYTSMDLDATMIEMDFLLQFAANIYYNYPEQVTITDADFDDAKKRLIELYTHIPELKPEPSIVDMVGAPVVSGGLFEPYQHRAPMLSLDNLFTLEDFYEWCDKLIKKLGYMPELALEYKYDGLAVELVYENGSLVVGSTRGNGIVGDDITENLRQVSLVPTKLKREVDITAYGEVVCNLEEYIEYNKTALNPFKNARNAAAGSLRLKDPSEVAKRPVEFKLYGLRTTDRRQTLLDDIHYAEQLGFIPYSQVVISSDREKLAKCYQQAYELRRDVNFEYDGLVLKVNKLEDRVKLGFGKEATNVKLVRAPEWAIAWKFPTEVVVTTLLNVTFQVGRTGVVTPVANIEPVTVNGATVSNGTLHNRDELERGNYCIGDLIRVHRAGEVVPQILGVVQHNNGEKVVYPDNCPCCGNPLTVDGAATLCTFINCPATLTRQLTHFVSKPAFNIEGISGAGIDQLFESGIVTEAANLFDANIVNMNSLTSLDGWGAIKAGNLLGSINKAREITLDHFLYALGCASMGERLSGTVARYAGSIDNFLALTKEELISLPKIGTEISQDIFEFINSDRTKKMIHDLIMNGVKVSPAPAITVLSDSLDGKTVCITGKFENYTRNELRDMVVSRGGKCTDSVSKKTDFLLCGEDAGSKLDKALNNGYTKVIYEGDIEIFFA